MSSTSSFPVVKLTYDPLTPLDSLNEPTAEAVRLLRRELYANVRVIPNPDHPDHGYLGLIMKEEEYMALAHEPFNLPDRPEVPDYAQATDANDKSEMETHYNNDLQYYYDAHGLHMQLRNLMIAAIPDDFIALLGDEAHGLAETSVNDILTHLMDSYGAIDDMDLKANIAKLSAPWDPSTPIITVFTNGKRCRKFAADGQEPIPDKAYVRLIVDVFKQSGVFKLEVDDWHKKPLADRTVANMQAHFIRANKTRRQSEEGLKSVLSANSAITNKADTSSSEFKGLHYCWSHGICEHNGTTCPTPANGHVKEATAHNLCGGCTFMQRPPGYQAVFRLPPRPRDTDKAQRNKEKQKAAAKLAKATEEAATQKAFADAVALAVAAQLHQ